MNGVPVWLLIIVLALIGALGGFINWFFIGPHYKGESNGYAGNVLFGALAPIFIIGMYGTLSPMKLNANTNAINADASCQKCLKSSLRAKRSNLIYLRGDCHGAARLAMTNYAASISAFVLVWKCLMWVSLLVH